MSNVDNPSFEEAGATAGLAADWSVAYVNSEEEFADFDLNPSDADTASQETFDAGWTPPDDQMLLAAYEGLTIDIIQAVFDTPLLANAIERYDNGWSVVDPGRIALLWPGAAVQPDSQVIAPPGATSFYDFDTASASTVAERFENGWPDTPTSMLAYVDASWDTANFARTGSTESFERWKRKAFVPDAGAFTLAAFAAPNGVSYTYDAFVVAGVVVPGLQYIHDVIVDDTGGGGQGGFVSDGVRIVGVGDEVRFFWERGGRMPEPFDVDDPNRYVDYRVAEKPLPGAPQYAMLAKFSTLDPIPATDQPVGPLTCAPAPSINWLRHIG